MIKDNFARIAAIVAVIFAFVAVMIAFNASGNAPDVTSGSTANFTATAGKYVAGLGFGVGTEKSFTTVFNSSAQLTLGSGSNAVTALNPGFCVIFPYSTTIAASSSAQVDCQAGTVGGLLPLSGVVYGDKVFASLSTSSSSTYGGLSMDEVSASSTPGYISMRITNFTGTTFTWSSVATSGVSYIDIR